MNPTQPSSTPITAEGAVKILREALAPAIKIMETLDTIRHIAPFPELDYARAALAATDVGGLAEDAITCARALARQSVAAPDAREAK